MGKPCTNFIQLLLGNVKLKLYWCFFHVKISKICFKGYDFRVIQFYTTFKKLCDQPCKHNFVIWTYLIWLSCIYKWLQQQLKFAWPPFIPRKNIIIKLMWHNNFKVVLHNFPHTPDLGYIKFLKFVTFPLCWLIFWSTIRNICPTGEYSSVGIVAPVHRITYLTMILYWD